MLTITGFYVLIVLTNIFITNYKYSHLPLSSKLPVNSKYENIRNYLILKESSEMKHFFFSVIVMVLFAKLTISVFNMSQDFAFLFKIVIISQIIPNITELLKIHNIGMKMNRIKKDTKKQTKLLKKLGFNI